MWKNRTPTLETLIKDGCNPFMFDYSIHGGSEHKEDLQRKMMDEYLFENIGFLPEQKWLQRWRTRFLKLLPYYNQRYATAALEYDPLITYVSTTIRKDKANSTNIHQYQSGSTTETTGSQRDNGYTTLHTDTIDHAETVYAEDTDGSTDTTGHSGTVSHETTTGHKDTSSNVAGKTTDTYTEHTDGTNQSDTTQQTIGNSERDTTESQQSQNTNVRRFSDTPQSELNSGGSLTSTWLTDYTQTTDSGTVEKQGHETINSNENVTGHVEGKDTTDKTHTGSGTSDTTTVGNEETRGTKDTTSDTDTTGHSESEGHKEGDSATDEEGSIDTATRAYNALAADSKAATSIGVAERYDKDDKARQIVTDMGRKGQSPSALLMEWRAAIVNVDAEFIDAMSILFKGVVEY